MKWKRIDKNNMPKHENPIIVLTKSGCYYVMRYQKRYKKWDIDRFDYYVDINEIITFCEYWVDPRKIEKED